MNKISNAIKCCNCKDLLDSPVLLPCYHSICNKHTLNLKGPITCNKCKLEHPIPPNVGFPYNEALAEIIDAQISTLHFGKEHKAAKQSCEHLEQIVKKFKETFKDPLRYVYEAIDYLENVVQFKGDEMKLKIDETVRHHISRMEEYKKNCKSTTGEYVAKLETFDRMSQEKLDKWMVTLNELRLNKNEYRLIKDECEKAAVSLETELSMFKKDFLLQSRFREFTAEIEHDFGQIVIDPEFYINSHGLNAILSIQSQSSTAINKNSTNDLSMLIMTTCCDEDKYNEIDQYERVVCDRVPNCHSLKTPKTATSFPLASKSKAMSLGSNGNDANKKSTHHSKYSNTARHPVNETTFSTITESTHIQNNIVDASTNDDDSDLSLNSRNKKKASQTAEFDETSNFEQRALIACLNDMDVGRPRLRVRIVLDKFKPDEFVCLKANQYHYFKRLQASMNTHYVKISNALKSLEKDDKNYAATESASNINENIEDKIENVYADVDPFSYSFKRGDYAAVYWNKNWSRCLVLEVSPDNKRALVECLDICHQQWFHLSKLGKLLEGFMVLPRYAFRARLNGLDTEKLMKIDNEKVATFKRSFQLDIVNTEIEIVEFDEDNLVLTYGVNLYLNGVDFFRHMIQ